MRKFQILLALTLAVLLQATASAQSLAGSADALRGTLGELRRIVDETTRNGREDLLKHIDRGIDDLAKIHDRVKEKASRKDTEKWVSLAQTECALIMQRLGGRQYRGDIAPLVERGGRELEALNAAWGNYRNGGGGGGYGYAQPDYNGQRQAAQSRADEEAAAADVIGRYLRVQPESVQVTRITNDGVIYRVWARVSGVGSYSYDIDGTRRRVIQSRPAY